MKAFTIETPGSFNNLVLTEVADPKPGPGEVVIEVAFAGCNWGDTQIRRGTYSFPVNYPVTPGYEVAGIVTAVGADVEDVRLGDRVAALVASGGYAEKCVAPSRLLIALPPAMDFATAAAFPIQALTAYHMLFTVFGVGRGDMVLVHAIGGGVGLFCTQLAVGAGARVIGTVATPGKEKKPLAYGAEKVVFTPHEDFVPAAMDVSNGKGVDLAIDSLGGNTLDRTFAAVRVLGHIISIGEAEGKPLGNIRERLMQRSQTFTRFSLGKLDPTVHTWRKAVEGVVEGVASGSLDVPIAATFPFEQAGEMQRQFESRELSGKLLLAVNPALGAEKAALADRQSTAASRGSTAPRIPQRG
jgi:NADPH:quinone reductase